MEKTQASTNNFNNEIKSIFCSLIPSNIILLKNAILILILIFAMFFCICFTGTHTGRTAMAESTGIPTFQPALPMFTRTENRAGFYIRERTGS